MGNKASYSMMLPSPAAENNMKSLLEHLDKFMQPNLRFTRHAKQDAHSVNYLEGISAEIRRGVVGSQTLDSLRSSSGFKELVRTLLQNNSMGDIERRTTVYHTFLELLVLLASNPHTIGFFQESLTSGPGSNQSITRSGTAALTLLAALSRRSKLYLQLHPQQNHPQYHAADPEQVLKLKSVHISNAIVAVDHYVDQRMCDNCATKETTSLKRSSDGDVKPPSIAAPAVKAAAGTANATEVAVQKVMAQLDELYKVQKSSWVSSLLGFHPGGSGTGFGGSYGASNSLSQVPGVAKATQAEAKHDKAVQECVEKLHELLSHTEDITAATLGILQEHAGFRRMCVHLLHNDSLLDICRRIPVYTAILQLLRTVACNAHTAQFLVQPLMPDDKDKGKDSSCVKLLSALSHQSRVYLQLQGEPTGSSTGVASAVQPQAAAPRVTTRSAATAAAVSKTSSTGNGSAPAIAVPQVEASAPQDESVAIANTIIATELAVKTALGIQPAMANASSSSGPSQQAGSSSLGSSLIEHVAQTVFNYVSTNGSPSATTDPPLSGLKEPLNAAPASRTKSSAQTRSQAPTQAEVEDAYVAAMTPLRFAAVDLVAQINKHTAKHYYQAAAGSTPSQTATQSYQASRAGVSSNPKQRLTRIAKEMATLSTSLPVQYGSSIFLRVDESRMDLIKALIIGPLGTPYAHGCFEFDILLPPDYPHRPPSVMLVTTGGGTVRFNPNLYNNGYVCLSLLGTWSGPGWDAQHSALLQVLVSIQSLIMVPDPYYNEPGYEYMRNSPASKAYNQNIKYQCLRFAVHEQLRAPPSVFRDVIRAHFSHKRAALLQQMDAWRSDLSGGDGIIDSVKAELNKL